ncbi:MAG: o-succinylbenzoate synthase [Anaerolineales bacterium]
MQPEEIHLYQIALPLKTPFVTANGATRTRITTLLELRAEGISGWGECVAEATPAYFYETAETAWSILRDFLIPQAFQHPLDTLPDVEFWQRGVRGYPMAKAALEVAAWDWWGNRYAQNVATLLGGTQTRVPVGVAVGLHATPAALLQTVAQYLAEGYRRVKIKIEPGRDLPFVRAVRREFPNLPLQVDANAAYTPADTEVLRALDEYNLLLIEQPFAEDDLLHHAALQRVLQTPVCLDEGITSLRAAEQALELGACRVLCVKLGRVGGLHTGRAIANLCAARRVPLWCGGMLESGIGRAANLALAALPAFTLPGDISATARYFDEDILHEVFQLESDSTIQVPRSAGLGVQVNRAALKKFTRRSEKFTAH